MGHGTWDAQTYHSTTLRNIEKGKTFDYSNTMLRTQPRSAWKVNELLDPKRKNQQGDNSGTIVRESLDFEEHPNTTPIVVSFDVTGSMGTIPGVIVKELPKLMQALIDGGVPDPQVLIMAIGDANTDALPLQVGQFESDNRIDRQIEALVLEGGGGGQMAESYELGAFFLAHYTHLDSVILRGEKGFAFFIGDEQIYSRVNGQQFENLTGEKLGERDPDTKGVFTALRESFEPYFLFAQQGYYDYESIVPASTSRGSIRDYGYGALGWEELVGENVVQVPDAHKIVDVIVDTVAVAQKDRITA
jgi:hypothetical protein